MVLLCASTRFAAAETGRWELTVVDRDTGEPIPCRMHLTTAAGLTRKIPRTVAWNDHFVVPGKIALTLPLGSYLFELERGPEYLNRGGHFTIQRFSDDAKEFDLKRFVDMSKHGWWSGDLDVRRPVRDVELLMQAEDLHVLPLCTWSGNKSEWTRDPPPENPLVRFDGDRYYHLMTGSHTWPGGRMLYFNQPKPLALSAAAAEYPPPTEAIAAVRENPEAWVDLAKPFCWDLPMLVAGGHVDSIQIAHSDLGRKTVVLGEAAGKPRSKLHYPGLWGGARWSQDIYFRLLNCGLRIPPSAGSGSGMGPNPAGYNRVYVHVDSEFTYESWWENFRLGRVTVTNGPLLRPTVHGRLPGHVFTAAAGEELELEIALTLSTRDKISYLEIVKDGRVVESVRLSDYAKTGKLPPVHFDQSGWLLVRAVADVQETYRFAITGPYYVEFDGRPRISRESAQFFLDWVYERARQFKLDSPTQQAAVLEPHRVARDFWQDLVSRANAE